jgi:hypothetical protein
VRELNSARVATSKELSQSHFDQSVVASVPLQSLVDDPATRDVLSRCVPELLPDSEALTEWGKLTLSEIGRFDSRLTSEKLQVIDSQLSRAHTDSVNRGNP